MIQVCALTDLPAGRVDPRRGARPGGGVQRRRRAVRDRRHLHPPGRVAVGGLARGLHDRVPAARGVVRPADRQADGPSGQAAGPHLPGAGPGRRRVRGRSGPGERCGPAPADDADDLGGVEPGKVWRDPTDDRRRRRLAVRAAGRTAAAGPGLRRRPRHRRRGAAPPLRPSAAVQGVPARDDGGRRSGARRPVGHRRARRAVAPGCRGRAARRHRWPDPAGLGRGDRGGRGRHRHRRRAPPPARRRRPARACTSCGAWTTRTRSGPS